MILKLLTAVIKIIIIEKLIDYLTNVNSGTEISKFVSPYFF